MRLERFRPSRSAIVASARRGTRFARVDAAVPEAERRLADGVTKVAHVLYATG